MENLLLTALFFNFHHEPMEMSSLRARTALEDNKIVDDLSLDETGSIINAPFQHWVSTIRSKLVFLGNGVREGNLKMS